jgi:hypothetical protein
MDVTALTTVEVPQGSNAIVDVTSEAMEIVTAPNDIQPNGIIAEQQQAQATIQQLPPLFDMDLERMHSELFRGRYLTPQDFMDDILKIVHNADVRSNEDSRPAVQGSGDVHCCPSQHSGVRSSIQAGVRKDGGQGATEAG